MSREEWDAAVAAVVARAPEPSPATRERLERLLRPGARAAGGGAR